MPARISIPSSINHFPSKNGDTSSMNGSLASDTWTDYRQALSAIYFFSDPAERQRGLGTWNVLSIVERAAELGIPYVYLGYHIADYRSLAYKANFVPNQKRMPEGLWQDYRP